MTHVVIVGAGLLGSAVADELAAAGVDVTVLDAAIPGQGTSGSSFAWVNAQDKSPAPYFELNAEAVRTYPQLAAELGGGWYHPGGDLAIGRGGGAPKLAEKIERHRALGYAVRELDRDAAVGLEPHLELEAEGEFVAAHFPEEGWIDAPRLVERRLARAVERGALLDSGTPVRSFTVAGGRVVGIGTDVAEHRPDLVVVAAGPDTERLVGEAGAALPMSPSPGLLVTIAPADGLLSRVVHAGDVAMRPDGSGRLLLSSRGVDAELEPATRTMEAGAPECQELVSRAARILPDVAGSPVERARIGVRSVATDGQPVAGFAPGVENLYLLVAHSGATLAPVLGRLVAAELTGSPQGRLDPYRPARFS